MTKTPKTPSLNQRAEALAEKTADAYSFDRFANWRSCARLLLARGYSEREAEAILRSKWMRWAGDMAEKTQYGNHTSIDLAHFLDKRGARSMFKTDADLGKEVAELVAGTFND